MLLHRPIALTVLLLALSACAEPEQEIIPVLVAPSPEVQRQAAAEFAADLSVDMEDDERAFAQALARKGWAAMRDCMER
jgi:hypothetical protein